jgi:Domain of unknown function (DUF5615)
VARLLLHFPGIDLVRVQAGGLTHTPDPVILESAASQKRAIVTHDRNTMTAHAQDRLTQGLAMSGLIVLDPVISFGKAIQEVGTLDHAGDHGDLAGQILFLS